MRNRVVSVALRQTGAACSGLFSGLPGVADDLREFVAPLDAARASRSATGATVRDKVGTSLEGRIRGFLKTQIPW